MKRIIIAGLALLLPVLARADLHPTPTITTFVVTTGTSTFLNATTLTSSSFTVTAATATFLNASTATLTHIMGTTTNDNATVGTFGEYLSSVPVVAQNAGTTNQFANIASITLTAGDWNVSGLGVLNLTLETVSGNCAIALSAFSGNTQTDHVMGDNQVFGVVQATNGDQYSYWTIPEWRQSLASTTTIYLKGLVNFSGGTGVGAWSGRISARRVR